MNHSDQASLFADYPEVNVYLVGGAVRDALLGLPVTERDWVVVGATPALMRTLGFRAVGRGFPVFLHPQDGEEYALARRERKTAPGHTGFSLVADPGVTLEQDLSRRDLTINAMARSSEGELVDPCNGRRDLADGVLRHISRAFAEDPLRLLRVARFAASLADRGFTVASETLTLLRQIATGGELATLPAERIWRELEKALATPRPSRFFEVVASAGAMVELFPELAPGFDDGSPGEALDRAARAGTTSEVRYAVLNAGLDEQAARELAERLRAPRRYRDLAVLCASLADSCRAENHLREQQLLHVIERTDALRRPQRFEAFLEVCAWLHPQQHNGERLRRARDAIAGIQTRELLARGLEPPELARELERLRLEALRAVVDTRG